jgi:hypothetical protein
MYQRISLDNELDMIRATERCAIEAIAIPAKRSEWIIFHVKWVFFGKYRLLPHVHFKTYQHEGLLIYEARNHLGGQGPA